MNELGETGLGTGGPTEFYPDCYINEGYGFPDFQGDTRMLGMNNDIQNYPDSMLTSPTIERKRKMDDTPEGNDSKQMKLSQESQKKFVRQNHSEIEKRRRDKMNTYITELSSMIPTCVAMQRKMDKLTVLRLAVQHLKTIRGSLDSYAEATHKPPILTDSELRKLIIPSADGFIFVVDSARTRILYVSESVKDILNFSPQDLVGQSLFDILHPKDIDKVKEQLSKYDVPRERLIDSKTMLPLKGGDVHPSISRLHPGARRVFFCRMKHKPSITNIKQEDDTGSSMFDGGNCKRKKGGSSDKKYLSIQCTGYLKSWPLTKVGLSNEIDLEADSETCISCLVAVGRILPSFQPTIEDCIERNMTTSNGVEFSSRLSIDGKFTFVDQRVTLLLGYLPQELSGTSVYEHVHSEDTQDLMECHRNVLRGTEEVTTPFYKFKTKEGKFLKIKSRWKHFRNPWTQEIEYITCKNNLLLTQEKFSGSCEDSTSISCSGGTYPTPTTSISMGGTGGAVAVSSAPTTSTGTGVVGSTGNGNGTGGEDMYFGFNGERSGSQSPTSSGGNGRNGSKDMQRVISSHAEASKIGRHIADEVLEKWRSDSNQSSPQTTGGSPNNNLAGTAVGTPNCGLNSSGPNSVGALPVSSKREISLSDGDTDRYKMSGVIVTRETGTVSTPHSIKTSVPEQILENSLLGGGGNSPGPSSNSSDSGNDQAATAVLMSLLEAEGGLGGPFDFGSLPWPLP